MTSQPKPGGYWDRQDLAEAIRANVGIHDLLRQIADQAPRSIQIQSLVREAAHHLHDQQRALRDIDLRWTDYRRAR